ncbi:hypothetical protein SO802_027583 [Lithocarpus litseifolius]|uniref:Uncharacterized protein n=1 Tax=Lithocarpus litseifolius TaxID=425828 RepID=A0AAW2C4Z3_9ROSI
MWDSLPPLQNKSLRAWLPKEDKWLAGGLMQFLPLQKGALEGQCPSESIVRCGARGTYMALLHVEGHASPLPQHVWQFLRLAPAYAEVMIDAAETIEEAESVEQKTYWEKVEMSKKKKLELQVARSVKRRKASEGVAKESRQEESSSDDGSGENFAVDWRAQHL